LYNVGTSEFGEKTDQIIGEKLKEVELQIAQMQMANTVEIRRMYMSITEHCFGEELKHWKKERDKVL
jgi:hypothetical protein